MRLPDFGEPGQRALARSTALVVGCGALGTHLADGLTRAGIGRLVIVDRDIVEWSNLQRQVLFTESDAAEAVPKAVAAQRHLQQANSEVTIEAHVADCSAAFLRGLASVPDLVLDGTDNFPTRYVLNDWCRQQGRPWIYAGAVGTEGASMVIAPDGPCLRCLWPDPPQTADVGNCETAGILQPAIAAVTAFQLAEAFKLLLGKPTTRGVFTCDVWRGSYQVLQLQPQPAEDCVVCAHGRYPALTDASPQPATLCGRDAVQVEPPRPTSLSLEQLERHLSGSVEDLHRTEHLLRFSADGCRFTVFPGGRALLFGVQDPLRGKALYDRWLGLS